MPRLVDQALGAWCAARGAVWISRRFVSRSLAPLLLARPLRAAQPRELARAGACAGGVSVSFFYDALAPYGRWVRARNTAGSGTRPRCRPAGSRIPTGVGCGPTTAGTSIRTGTGVGPRSTTAAGSTTRRTAGRGCRARCGRRRGSRGARAAATSAGRRCRRAWASASASASASAVTLAGDRGAVLGVRGEPVFCAPQCVT